MSLLINANVDAIFHINWVIRSGSLTDVYSKEATCAQAIMVNELRAELLQPS